MTDVASAQVLVSPTGLSAPESTSAARPLDASAIVTVFGGGGFLGRYVVPRLLATGARVRVASRDAKAARHLLPLGNLGQVQLMPCDIRRPAHVAAALRDATHVVNLVSVFGKDAYAVNHEGAATVAAQAAAAGVSALVLMSAIGADAASEQSYARTKGAGAAATLAAFPGATVLAPSILFGAEDSFANRFARLLQLAPVLPVIKPDWRFQPVWVDDVAAAAVAALAAPELVAGKTLALGGPEAVTMRGFVQRIAKLTGRDRALVNVPDAVAGAMASATGWMPGAPLTSEQWAMLQSDNIVPTDSDGFTALGLRPAPFESVADRWLVPFRRHGRFTAVAG